MQPHISKTELLQNLSAICKQITHGDYVKAKELFSLTQGTCVPGVIQDLAEIFGMMLVKLETREFQLEQLVAELEAAYAQEIRLKEAILNENRQLRQGLLAKPDKQVIWFGHAMQNVMRQIERIAHVDATLLIQGETGSGKGLLAKTVHYSGARAKEPFVSINCAAIPSSLLESELFGIEKGVASGVNARIGRFEQANKGTLFLDEIGDMPLESQAKILHVIENKYVERIGGRTPIAVDVRIIAATHRDLVSMCADGRFRSDLYYRLNVLQLRIPPLRERLEDIPGLVRHFLQNCSTRIPMAARDIDEKALQLMQQYAWPGNIRELENETERAALLARGHSITEQDLSPTLASETLSQVLPVAPTLPDPELKMSRPAKGKTETLQVRSLEDAERTTVQHALREANGNKTRAAAILGISREGLRKMIKRLNIDV